MVNPTPERKMGGTLDKYTAMGTSGSSAIQEEGLTSVAPDQPNVTLPLGKVIPIDVKRGNAGTTGIIADEEEQHYYGEKYIPMVASKTDEAKITSSPDYTAVMRAHYLNPILKALEDIWPFEGSPSAALYINEIMYKIDELYDQSPADPILDVLFAFYDALAYKNNWTFYSADQYKKARIILKKYAERVQIKPKLVEKAIIELEELGFDTTPFELDYDEHSSI